MDEPSTTPSAPQPASPVDAPLIEYHTPIPPPGNLSRTRARPLAWLFGLDILLAAIFVGFSYLHQRYESKWVHHDDSLLPVLLAVIAVAEAIPLCLCLVRWRGARLLGLIFSAAHLALGALAMVWLWATLLFSDFPSAAVCWVGLLVVAGQGCCNVFLLSILYGEVVHPEIDR